MDSSNRSSPPPDLPQAVTASLAPSRSTSHDPWLVAQLLRLRHQNEELSRRVTQLLTQVAASDPQPQPARDGSMRELVARLNEQQDQIDQVEKALTKLSRTQFKANTLGEAQVEQVAAVLKALQQTNARHEAEQQGQRIARHEQDARARHEARTAVVMEMLPILDGLNAALESGERLLHRDEEAQPTADPGVWARFSRWLEGTPPVQGSPSRSTDPWAGWLDGLALVRERYEQLLADEAIHPVAESGRRFDPRLHVAVEAQTRDDVAAGTILSVLRQGYQQGERILRFAEVVVARHA
ncbi:MAG: nucleotide exchange factor GrpE [Anaerolineales bacterium]|nr:nucleotide exchange factor GrpE [Anaerolineales bacterium]MCB9126418.1 nucleotide exchange factor GrpE [Ardenticatenales bacterium]MCB9171579.1 nucleotide exchange factor GrpE [Ardenticatenales bacterium]